MKTEMKNGYLHGAYAEINTDKARRIKPSKQPEKEKEEIYFLVTATGSVILMGVAFTDMGNGEVLLPNAEFVGDGSDGLIIR